MIPASFTRNHASRLFTAISDQQINIIAIAQGSSELTIAIVVKEDRLRDAVRVVHQECRLGQPASSTAESRHSDAR